MTREQLINQQVILNTGDKLTIIDVEKENDLESLTLTFNNEKSARLLMAVKSGYVTFVDNKLQQYVLDVIAEHEDNQHQAELAKQAHREVVLEIAIKRAAKEAKIKATQKKRAKRSDPSIRIDRKNVAYKATYCDGGTNGWFRGPCSQACRERNCSRKGGEFCRTNSVCKKVEDGHASENEIQEAYTSSFLCYECNLLNEYKIFAGLNHDGTPRGWRLDNDRLVILTTIKPGNSEIDRVIFGAFLIKQSYDKDGDKEAYAISYPDCRLSLTEEEAEELKYWDYAPGEGKDHIIQWKEQLFRYQSDETCAIILRDLVKIIKKRNDPAQSEYAEAFYNKFLEKIHKEDSDIPSPSGPRLQ